MTAELVKSPASYTAVSLNSSGYTESVSTMTEELEGQVKELLPVLDFYDRLVRGWHGRILRAEQAMKNPLNQSDAQQKIFLELRNVAKGELEKHLPVYKEVKAMKEEIENRIGEFDLMRFKSTAPANSTVNVLDSFKQTQELLHRADALIELRKES
jgi:hypothetical protein